MKKRNLNLLYGIAIIAVTGALIFFVSYTTDVPAKSAHTLSTIKIDRNTPADGVDEKPCGCCAKRKAFLQEKIKQARANKIARQQVSNNPSH